MNYLDFDELNDLVNDSDFEEKPVGIETFVESEEYLGFGQLSEYQYKSIQAATQIYRKDTLIELYGEKEGLRRWSQTFNECIYMWGKGSGKDLASTIACAYVVYLLLCLKNPSRYYNKPEGDTIDIINVAINAKQANNVFFKNFALRIEKSPWFEGKFVKKQGQIEFDKSVSVYSGHSEHEGFEGYNVIFTVLDEISGFALESASGNQRANTADAVYRMYRDSVDSRFPAEGKVVLLSFPRFKEDFITQRYNEVVGEKDVIIRKHTFKINDELEDGIEENEFEIEWEEDHIISYKYPRVYALKRPTWEVNPFKDIEDLKLAFMQNKLAALGKFACMPPDAIDAFFKDRQKIDDAFLEINGVDEEGVFLESFQPKENTRYYVHVDLSKVQDKCAVAIAHVDKWRRRQIGEKISEEILPVVKVDAVRWWKPSKEKNIDFAEVRDYIVSLQQRGFSLNLVTFDRWRSDDLINYLNSIGIKSEVLSVAKRHYGDFAIVMHDNRLVGPDIDILKKELRELRIMPNDKVDHPRSGGKDLSDAVCGAIFNAVSYTPREMNHEIEISTWSSMKDTVENVIENKDSSVIKAPKRRIPVDLEEFLSEMEIL